MLGYPYDSLRFSRTGFKQPNAESELTSLLKSEYVCDRANTLICLSSSDEMLGFPNIVLQSCHNSSSLRCLADVKDRLCKLIQENPSVMGCKEFVGLSPLHLICSLHSPGQMKILKVLCTQRHSDVNVLDSFLRTPLHHAVSPVNMLYHVGCNDSGESLVDIVTLLIEHGANVNAVDCNGLTPLHLVLDYYGIGGSSKLRELPELVKTLLKAGATSLKAPSGGVLASLSPLHLACRLPGVISVDIVSLLITSKNVNCTDHLMRTPLHELVSYERKSLQHATSCQFVLDKVKLLMDCGADANAKDAEGMTPLLRALDNPRFPLCAQLVKLLLERGASPVVRIYHNRVAPLHMACKIFDEELLELVPLFLKAGARMNPIDDKHRTPFHYALLTHNRAFSKRSRYVPLKVLQCLVKYGADAKLLDVQNNNSLHMACSAPRPNFKEVISYLISLGCKLNHVNKEGNTPLLRFLQNSYEAQSIQTLIDLGADCRVVNLEGISPLHFVSRSLEFQNNVDEVVGIILKGGADVNLQDCLGCTPLHNAVRDESTFNMKAIRKLLLAGANSNIANSLGMTPFHIVCSNGNHNLAQMLLDFGADVNMKDAESNTPLHIAQTANENASSLAQVLVDNGADLTAKNCYNATPFVIMSISTHHFIIGYTVLLIVNGQYSLNEQEKNLLDRNNIFRKRFNDCFSCAPAMKTQYIGDSSITLLEFLLSKNKKAVRYLRNPAILSHLKLLTESVKYRWYRYMITQKISDLENMKTDLDRTLSSFNYIVSPFKIPDFVVEHILSFLDEFDMNSLNRAVHMAPLPLRDQQAS